MNHIKPITGRMVLFAMLGFFGIIFAVNGSFMYFAISSFPGLSTEKAYEKGLSFNQTLEDVEKQNALGWTSAVNLTLGGKIMIEMRNREGDAVRDLGVRAVLMRPLDNDRDQMLVPKELHPGTYQSSDAVVALGQWRVEITASQNNHPVFHKIHNVVVK